MRLSSARVFAVGILLGVWMFSAFGQKTSLPVVSPSAPAILVGDELPVMKAIGRMSRPNIPPVPTSDLVCLAQALFFEAAHEPMVGIEAVAAVVLNRVSSTNYPRTVCGVVYQRRQFSWTADVMNRIRRPPTMYVDMARTFLQNRAILRDQYPLYTHFHHVSVSPAWSEHLTYMGTYGQHKFYAQTDR